MNGYFEKVVIKGGKLEVGEESLEMQLPVIEAVLHDNKIIVLLDPDSRAEKYGQFPNLIAIDRSGTTVWTAELPTKESGDAYYRIASAEPLIVYSVFSYSCRIDPQTGKIEEKRFFK